MLGAVFDEALLRAVATEPGTVGGALDRLVEADLHPAGRAPRARAAAYRFTHALVHEVVYQNLLLVAAHRAARAGGAGARARRRAAPRAAERPRSPRPPLEPQRGQAPGRPLPAGRRRLGARRSTRTTTRSATTSAPSAPSPSAGLRRPRRGRARERLADLLGLTGRRAEALAHYEAVRAEIEAGRRPRGRRARCTGRSAGSTGRRATASGPAPASRRASSGSATDGDPIERAHLFQEMGRLAFRAGDNAGAIAWAERALAEAAGEEEAAAEPARAREAAAMRAQAYNTLGRRARAHGAPGRGGRADRAEHRAGRGARSAAGGLPRLHEPRRALQLARSAAEHRDLPARARDGEEGGRSRLPVAPLREPRGGLLRAHRPLRGGGHRGRADRPSTSTAGWGCSITWRCR